MIHLLMIVMAALPQNHKAGPEHKRLHELVGEWNVETTVWFSADKDGETSKATETMKKGPGELWIYSAYKGTFMDKPFLGRFSMGYDQAKKKYVGTWMDSSNSSMTTLEGDYDNEKKAITFKNKTMGPDKEFEFRSVMTFTDKDHHTYAMYFPGPDGKEFKALEFKYTRKKKNNK